MDGCLSSSRPAGFAGHAPASAPPAGGLVGTTFQPRQRFAALLHEEVLAFELGDRAVERRRHAEFADDRLGTSEWFALTPRLRAHIEQLAAGSDPWHVHARWMADALRRLS
jgi:hypothetical protein